MSFDKIRAYGRTFARILPRYRELPADLLRLLVRRPTILSAVAAYETALMVSGRVDSRLKVLASLKTSSLIGCPF